MKSLQARLARAGFFWRSDGWHHSWRTEWEELMEESFPLSSRDVLEMLREWELQRRDLVSMVYRARRGLRWVKDHFGGSFASQMAIEFLRRHWPDGTTWKEMKLAVQDDNGLANLRVSEDGAVLAETGGSHWVKIGPDGNVCDADSHAGRADCRFWQGWDPFTGTVVQQEAMCSWCEKSYFQSGQASAADLPCPACASEMKIEAYARRKSSHRLGS